MESEKNEYCDDCGGTCACVDASKEITKEPNDLDTCKTIADLMLEIRNLDAKLFVDNFNQPAEFVVRKYRNYARIATKNLSQMNSLAEKIKDESLKSYSFEVLKFERLNYLIREKVMSAYVWVTPFQPHLQVGFFVFLIIIVLRLLLSFI